MGMDITEIINIAIASMTSVADDIGLNNAE
jgi:hypothetical protein